MTYGEEKNSNETGTVRRTDATENETDSVSDSVSDSRCGSDSLMNVGSGGKSDRTNTTVNVSATDLSVILTGLRPSTNYSITVAAYNNAGVGRNSDTLFVKTNGEQFSHIIL